MMRHLKASRSRGRIVRMALPLAHVRKGERFASRTVHALPSQKPAQANHDP